MFPTAPPARTFPPTQFDLWQQYRCAYEVWQSEGDTHPPLLLIPPIGVGLSRRFWDRWLVSWLQLEQGHRVYNPDLLGCGEGDMPPVAYHSADWAEQLLHLLQTVIQRPVILLVQGASCSIGLELVQKATPEWIRGMVLSGPPSWAVITQATPSWQQHLSWNLLDSPLGQGFYRYAQRRAFIQSFSIRQLFADPAAVDQQWLDQLTTDAENTESRYAVFSFLAGFWRRDYAGVIEQLAVPTLVVLGNRASSISRAGKSDTPDQRMADYLKHLPHGQGIQITGRNVLPYESAAEFAQAILPFIQTLQTEAEEV